jgi:dihydroxy-acid dehydratase
VHRVSRCRSSKLPSSHETGLRSSAWFVGDDEVALAHRVVLRSVGVDGEIDGTRPVIGIADSTSELNPCNLPLAALAERVAEGVRAAGGIPLRFPVMSLGEDLMKPTAMLYRNQLSMEVEEYIRAYPIDGIVLLANCDKSVPGALMGAVSADIPTLVLTAGARTPAIFKGRRIGTGTDLWRAWDARRRGELDDSDWHELERCLACGLGACNTMGTASSMAVVVEALGLCLPGSASIPTDDPDRTVAADRTGRRIVEMTNDSVKPSDVLTLEAFDNAVRLLSAVGGSTNAVLHLLALAGRTCVPLNLDRIGRVAAEVPVLANVEPSGRLLMQDFHAAGGVPAVVHELGDLIDGSALTASGRTWAQEARPGKGGEAIMSRDAPLVEGGSFAVVRGSLAPRGALLKTSASSPELMSHSGPALVFNSYDEMRARIDDPDLEVTADSVLVLAGAGPVGVPGMPEWGMIPIPAKLAEAGVRDMVRVTDARMSGTSFGTCVLHVAPEAAVGGPLALVRNGDMITLDTAAGRLELEVDAEELSRRAAEYTPPVFEHLRGWPALYQQHVTQADLGCDLDFLRADTPAKRRFVPPVVGRS